MQLKSSSDHTRAVVVSTLVEAWQIVKSGLVRDGIVDDVGKIFIHNGIFIIAQILYGLPVGPNKLGDLAELTDNLISENKDARLRIMVDNVWQVRALDSYGGNREWSVFVKVDHGGK
jgi:D-serine deaminase-like pyridoxal phosphate-dependent protein